MLSGSYSLQSDSACCALMRMRSPPLRTPALHHIADAELLGDLLHVDGLALVDNEELRAITTDRSVSYCFGNTPGAFDQPPGDVAHAGDGRL